MERIEFDLLFRWFVGLGADEPVWDASTFSKNRDRLLDGDVAARFLATLLARPRVKRLQSSDHFAPQASPIALMLNELLTNALKHGFPPGRSGRLTIAVKGEGKLLEGRNRR